MEKIMVNVGLLVRIEAKAGKEAAVAKFVTDALTLANDVFDPVCANWTRRG